MIFSFARRFAGLEKPSQDNAEYLNGGIASWPSRATKSPVYSALRWTRDLEHNAELGIMFRCYSGPHVSPIEWENVILYGQYVLTRTTFAKSDS
jgi:hypothetical protein